MWYRKLAWISPVEAADRLLSLPGLSFLDSAMRHDVLGRYSYVAADPFGFFAVRNGSAWWNGAPVKGHPLEALRSRLRNLRMERLPDLPPFQGGAIGYFAYDFAHCFETLATPKGRWTTCDDVYLSFYDVVLAWDHLTDECWLLASGWPEQQTKAREARANCRMDEFLRLLTGPSREQCFQPRAGLAWRSNFTREGYLAAVERVKSYIRAGDIYQANIAQRFCALLFDDFHPWDFYRCLRLENPATFAAYLSCGNLAVASSSPERFLQLKGRRVDARPIKGTIKRSCNPLEDLHFAEFLLESQKDRAENTMIVDLLRNDLSKICLPNTVTVPTLCGLETYGAVHHLVSVIAGELRERADIVDLLQACFPGGSITGAPKLRAMDIITEIEGIARGLYCGCIGYIGFNGDADLNIVIRTVIMNNSTAIFHTGGGITALSEPEAEYQETLVKAARIFSAFTKYTSASNP